jgi:hypothetical protein
VGDGGAVEDKGEAGAVDDGGDGTGLQAAIANPNKSQEREKPLNFIALNVKMIRFKICHDSETETRSPLLP